MFWAIRELQAVTNEEVAQLYQSFPIAACWVCSVFRTASGSTVKLAGAWLGGYSLNVSINSSAWITP